MSSGNSGSGKNQMEREERRLASRQSCVRAVLVACVGALLVFVLMQIPIARAGPANTSITAWEEFQAFRHLSPECQIDWVATYVFAGADWARVGILVMVWELPQRGPVEAAKLAWTDAAADWNRFVSRGSAEMENGLKNVNPMCPLRLPPK